MDQQTKNLGPLSPRGFYYRLTTKVTLKDKILPYE